MCIRDSVLTSHEQGAAHAADGYARATGKVGVCMATSGPGATNLVTGIATAQMDSIPLVAITANQVVPLLGKDSFQEVDITGVTMPITKHNFIVKRVEDLAPTIRKAFQIAKEGDVYKRQSYMFVYQGKPIQDAYHIMSQKTQEKQQYKAIENNTILYNYNQYIKEHIKL